MGQAAIEGGRGFRWEPVLVGVLQPARQRLDCPRIPKYPRRTIDLLILTLLISKLHRVCDLLLGGQISMVFQCDKLLNCCLLDSRGKLDLKINARAAQGTVDEDAQVAIRRLVVSEILAPTGHRAVVDKGVD